MTTCGVMSLHTMAGWQTLVANGPPFTLQLFCAGGGDTASKLRGFCFYLWTLALSIPLFVVMLVMAPFVMLRDKVRYALYILCSSLRTYQPHNRRPIIFVMLTAGGTGSTR